ncbi:hypothetical protein [Okeania sp. SIO2B3]|uniref:hypothetical protein n=1 Tax=Okeania sp. SIO2B3 TaxID=2607784 RepID=UPI0013C196AA|nr:hypothetical protein [Okeania sp. SIO2B3]NET41923.1 hypothetical protein [Okeania sp. SIO2B3]
MVEQPGKLKQIFSNEKRKFSKSKPDPLTFHANKLSLADFEAYLLGNHELAKARIKADCLVLELTEKLWFKASPFKGIIKKNFHLFVNPLLSRRGNYSLFIIHYSLFIVEGNSLC